MLIVLGLACVVFGLVLGRLPEWSRKKYTARTVPGVDGKSHVQVRAGNHEIVVHSEAFSRKEDAERAARELASVRIVFEE